MAQNTIGDAVGSWPGSRVVTELQQLAAARLSTDSGSNRPSYAVAGTQWLQTGSSAWPLYTYTGSTDIPMGVFDTTRNVFRVAVDRDRDSYIVSDNDDQIAVYISNERIAYFDGGLGGGLTIGDGSSEESLNLASPVPMRIPSGTTSQRRTNSGGGGRNFWFNSTDQRLEYWNGNQWIQFASTTDGRGSVGGLNDVVLTNPSNGQGLIWNATNGRWENGAIAANVQDGTVTTAKLADGAVTTSKISGLTGTSSGFLQADGDGTVSIGTPQGGGGTPADGSITTAKLANGAVTNAKVANDAIDSTKLAGGAVVGAAIADGAVSTAKISGLSGTSSGFLQADGDGTISIGTPSGGGSGLDAAGVRSQVVAMATGSNGITVTGGGSGATQTLTVSIGSKAVNLDRLNAGNATQGHALLVGANGTVTTGAVSGGGGGATTLPALTDVTISSQVVGEVLLSTGTNTWGNGKVGAAGLADGAITGGKLNAASVVGSLAADEDDLSRGTSNITLVTPAGVVRMLEQTADNGETWDFAWNASGGQLGASLSEGQIAAEPGQSFEYNIKASDADEDEMDTRFHRGAKVRLETDASNYVDGRILWAAHDADNNLFSFAIASRWPHQRRHLERHRQRHRRGCELRAAAQRGLSHLQ